MRSRKLIGAAMTAALMLTGAQAGAENLIENGSFEAPLIGEAPGNGCTVGSANSWIFCPSTFVPGWSVVWAGVFNPGQAGNLEFQNANTGYGPIPEGLQIAELASHPAGIDARVKISQTINGLCPFDGYTLSFSARKRETNDQLTYTVDGNSYTANSDFGAWTVNEKIFTPSSSSAVISFEETGPGGTIGTVLDNVVLKRTYTSGLCEVTLDAKPGSNPNAVNLCSGKGVVPVAFVGTANFDPNDWTIKGVSLSSDSESMDFFAGRGNSDACKIEDVVNGTNPSAITPDGFDDVVCQIPTMDMSEAVDTTTPTSEVTACLILNDGVGDFKVCASDDLKLSRTCD